MNLNSTPMPLRLD